MKPGRYTILTVGTVAMVANGLGMLDYTLDPLNQQDPGSLPISKVVTATSANVTSSSLISSTVIYAEMDEPEVAEMMISGAFELTPGERSDRS